MEKGQFGKIRDAIKEQTKRNAESRRSSVSDSSDTAEAIQHYRDLKARDPEEAKLNIEWQSREWSARQKLGDANWLRVRLVVIAKWREVEASHDVDMQEIERTYESEHEKISAQMRLYEKMGQEVRAGVLANRELLGALGGKAPLLKTILEDLNEIEQKLFLYAVLHPADDQD